MRVGARECGWGPGSGGLHEGVEEPGWDEGLGVRFRNWGSLSGSGGAREWE